MVVGAIAGLVMAIVGDEDGYRMRRITAFLDPFADKPILAGRLFNPYTL